MSSTIVMTKTSSTPANPDTGRVRIYLNDDGTLASVDETGTVKVYDFNVTQEQIEDYVAGLITSTVTVQKTYNDAGNVLYFDVLPGGVDHNQLLNYAANRHIDHTAVSVVAGTGLSGGGDISASRTLNLADTAITSGTYGSAALIPVITFDQQGRATAASQVAHLTGTPISQTPDQSNSSGSSSSLAKSDHVHNIATAAASSLTTSSTNTQGSAASFARSDHTHSVSIVNSRVASTTQLSTTSTSYVLMTGQTLTPAAGTYRVQARAVITATSNGRTVSLAIYSGGLIVADSEVTTYVRTGSGFLTATDIESMYTDTVVTVNGSQAIEMRWFTSGGTVQAQGYSLSLLKLSN